MRRIYSIPVLCLILAGSSGAASGKVNFISKDKPAPLIVIGAEAVPSEKYAAEEMAVYLEKITGKRIEVIDDSNIPEGKVIAMGKSKLTESIDISSLDCEQYIIDVQPDKLLIIGGRREAKPGQSARDAGTLYGVYEFLESLGVRWYRPEPWGEHVPKLVEISLEIGRKVSSKPSYMMRCMLGGGMSYCREETENEMQQAAAWSIRNRLNTVDMACRAGEYALPVLDIKDVAKVGGQEHYEWGHIYKSIIPESEYFSTHPEYFALVKGKRVPYDLCHGNLELQRIFAEKLIAIAKANPHWSSLSAEPSDCMGGVCECDLCKALDGPQNTRVHGEGSNRVAAFNNIVARMVARDAPWVKVEWCGYATHTAAPTNITRLEPNTIIMLAPICQWDDWRKKLMDGSSDWNALFVKTTKDWSALKPHCLMVYQYWEGYGWPGPIPVTRTAADRLRNYRKLGIEGIYNEPVVSWGPQGLDYYMIAKLAWNPDIDVDQELNLYYKNYYGPAEMPMKAYHERLMVALETAKYPVRSGGRGMHLVCAPALIEELGKHIGQAQALVKGQPLYERRLKGVWAGYEFCRRISAILVLKKKHGVLKDIPGWNGRGSYYESAEADKAYGDMIRWMRTVNAEDFVFDMALRFKEDAAESIFSDGDPGACWLTYLPLDLLRNEMTPNRREEVVLEDF